MIMFRRRMPPRLRHWWNCDGILETESPPLTDVLDQLERWVLSLPWVEPALSDSDGEGLRAFALVCPPLGCDSVWLFIAHEGEAAEGLDVNVVLPRKLGRRGAELGWADQVLELSSNRVVASVSTPTTAAELCALQALLVVAYDAAFEPI
jgi:hypothetical protein